MTPADRLARETHQRTRRKYRSFMKLMSLGAVFLVAAVALNAPQTATTRLIPKPTVVPVIAVPPSRGAVLYDVTASREEARIAASLDDFAPIFDRLRTSGGEIGFGLIREDSTTRSSAAT
jgi:hypothetical protein